MTTSDRIEQNSFCYDPDFPPDVAEGLPLVSEPEAKRPPGTPVGRTLKAWGGAAAALVRRPRSES
jgi:hypothetical protein